MRSERVLLVSSHALPHIGGVEVLVDREVNALAEAGHAVTLVTSDLGGSGRVPAYPDSVTVIRVPSSSFLERRFGLFCPVFSPRLLPILWREVRRCSVVHAHGFIALNSFAALLVAWLLGKPRILTEHNGVQPRKTRLATVLVRLLTGTLGRLSVMCAERCVTYNARVMADLHRLGGRRKPVDFVPYPVDHALFHPPTAGERAAARTSLGWADGRKKVLFVGRLVPEKGIPLLLGAVNPAEYDLVFCGSGDPAVLGSLPRPGVEYLPPRPQHELVPVYHAADLFVLPSYVEGFPLVAREAMACGLTTVLGYDPGYEPYRAMPELRFCALSADGVRDAIRGCLSPPIVMGGLSTTAGGLFDPTPEAWVRRIYRTSDPPEAFAVPTAVRVGV